MPIGNKRKDRVYSDTFPRTCFDAWLEAGTLMLAAKLLNDRGFRGSDGNAPPWTSVLAQANKYMVENPEEAKVILMANGYPRFSDKMEWADFIVPRAHKFLSERQFFRWLVRYDLLELAREKKMIPANYGKDRIQ